RPRLRRVLVRDRRHHPEPGTDLHRRRRVCRGRRIDAHGLRDADGRHLRRDLQDLRFGYLSIRSCSNTLTLWPASFPMAFRTAAVTGSLCVPSPIAMNELWNACPSMVPRTFTRPRVPKNLTESGMTT